MSDDVSLPIQQAVIAALKADAALAAIIGARAYDDVPADAAFPYACLTGWQHVPEEADCFDVAEYFFDFQCFSRSVGRVEVGRIARAVRGALARRELAIGDGLTASISHRTTLYFDEPDGLTRRAVLNFVVTSDQF